MPSEKLRYIRKGEPRDEVFYHSIESEHGEQVLSMSRDHEAMWVSIRHEFQGRQEIAIPIADVDELIRRLQECLRR